VQFILLGSCIGVATGFAYCPISFCPTPTTASLDSSSPSTCSDDESDNSWALAAAQKNSEEDDDAVAESCVLATTQENSEEDDDAAFAEDWALAATQDCDESSTPEGTAAPDEVPVPPRGKRLRFCEETDDHVETQGPEKVGWIDMPEALVRRSAQSRMAAIGRGRRLARSVAAEDGGVRTGSEASQ